LAIIWLSGVPCPGRVGSLPHSLRRQLQPLASVPQMVLPGTDPQVELAADLKQGRQFPLRFAVEHWVHITPETHGVWEQLPEGRLWRFRVGSAGATDLNLGFSTFWLPEGATLHVLAESQAYYQGPYTSEDNKPHGQLWTPVVPGDRAVIELFVPAAAIDLPRVVLTQINSGYRNLFRQGKDLSQPLTAGLCNLGVACPQASGWSNEVRSVARYSIAGTTLCTGTLVANAAGDFRNYFLTANHCGLSPSNAASIVVYWNYQSPVCGEHGGGSLSQNQSGAVFRAARYDVDFALVELEETPDSNFNVFYSGWDRSGIAPANSVGIHHPSGAEKSISFCSETPATVNSCIETGGIDTHWQVVWSAGVTEAGSSGSGLWDAVAHCLVGTLSGGNSSCANPTAPDCYGKLSAAWDGGNSSSERLREWLDPQNTALLYVPGADPKQTSGIRAAASAVVSESCWPTNGAIDPGETVTVNFALTNVGNIPATDLVATLLATNGVITPSSSQDYGILSMGSPSVSRPFSFTATGACGSIITPVLQLRDGSRDLGAVSFQFALGVPTPNIFFSENFDGMVAPELPANGWMTSVTGAAPHWVTSTALSDTAPNAAFAPDPPTASDNQLTSPILALAFSHPQLVFRHKYDLEQGFDGGVLEISLNGGAFADIQSAAGTFVTNGYTAAISSFYQNPLAGRRAWSGHSGGFMTTIVNLPPGLAGQNFQLRWRLGSDSSTGAGGWFLDTITLTQTTYTCSSGFPRPLVEDAGPVGPGQVAFSYSSLGSHTYFVEVATNLESTLWITMQTNVGDGSRMFFTNSIMSNRQQFFRIRAQ